MNESSFSSARMSRDRSSQETRNRSTVELSQVHTVSSLGTKEYFHPSKNRLKTQCRRSPKLIVRKGCSAAHKPTYSHSPKDPQRAHLDVLARILLVAYLLAPLVDDLGESSTEKTREELVRLLLVPPSRVDRDHKVLRLFVHVVPVTGIGEWEENEGEERGGDAPNLATFGRARVDDFLGLLAPRGGQAEAGEGRVVLSLRVM